MDLYHGSSYDFNSIDVTKGKPFKDFGVGFYTTPSIKHANSIAHRNQEVVRAKCKRKPTAYRYNLVFDYETSKLDTDFKILWFKNADIAWLDFILYNRDMQKTGVCFHGYDLVIGPTADENTTTLLRLAYLQLSESGRNYFTDSEKLELIRKLKPDNLSTQYCFCTNKAIHKGYLRFKQPQWRVYI